MKTGWLVEMCADGQADTVCIFLLGNKCTAVQLVIEIEQCEIIVNYRPNSVVQASKLL
jgi:hypothetical protein